MNSSKNNLNSKISWQKISFPNTTLILVSSLYCLHEPNQLSSFLYMLLYSIVKLAAVNLPWHVLTSNQVEIKWYFAEYLQDLVYKLSKIGLAIDNNDLSTAGLVLGGSTDTDWVKNANKAFNKVTLNYNIFTCSSLQTNTTISVF